MISMGGGGHGNGTNDVKIWKNADDGCHVKDESKERNEKWEQTSKSRKIESRTEKYKWIKLLKSN